LPQFQSFQIENPLLGRQTTLDFKNILTQEFFYQNANLGQVTAKSEKVDIFGTVHPIVDSLEM